MSKFKVGDMVRVTIGTSIVDKPGVVESITDPEHNFFPYMVELDESQGKAVKCRENELTLDAPGVIGSSSDALLSNEDPKCCSEEWQKSINFLKENLRDTLYDLKDHVVELIQEGRVEGAKFEAGRAKGVEEALEELSTHFKHFYCSHQK